MSMQSRQIVNGEECTWSVFENRWIPLTEWNDTYPNEQLYPQFSAGLGKNQP